MLRRLIASTATIAIAALSMAGPQTYANKQQSIGVGVVVLSSSVASSAPYAWMVLDDASRIKPAGWNISNPGGSTYVTSEIASRWSASGATVGGKLSKRNAAYWEVNLSNISDTLLAQYNVLLISPAATTSITPLERERLRGFVDRGGVLWVDSGSMGNVGVDPGNNLPIPFRNILASGASYFDTSSPLFDSVVTLDSSDLGALGGLGGYGVAAIDASSLGGFSATNYIGSQFEFSLNRSVGIRAGGVNNVTIGRIGDGFVVTTGLPVSLALNNGAGTGYLANSNSGYLPSTVAAAKFAVNLIGLANEYRQQGGGSRHANGNIFDLGAPLARRFEAESGPGAVLGNNASSSVYKGMIVASSSDHITVFDAKPGQDLDGDGDPDDGIGATSGGINDGLRDLSVGASYDRIWSSNTLPNPISSPSCTEVFYNGAWIDMVLVVDGKGTLHAYQLNAKNSNGYLIGGTRNELFTVTPPSGSAAVTVNGKVNPATIDGGLAIMADTLSTSTNDGRVWIVDLTTGQKMASANDWRVGGGGTTAEALPIIANPATVGYIPIQDNSGGLDRVIYVTGNVSNGTTQYPTMVSLWLGAKGEKPEIAYDATLQTLKVRTRASGVSRSGDIVGQPLPIYMPSASGSALSISLAPKLTVIGTNGVPWSTSQMNSYITGGPSQSSDGELTYQTQGLNATTVDQLGFRIDYTVDWGKDPATYSRGIERGRLQFPVPTNVTRNVLGPVAMSAKGTCYVVIGNVDASGVPVPGAYGEFYAIRENAGRGNFRVVNRYSLYPSHTMTLSQPTGNTMPPVLEDTDDITNLPGMSTYLKGDLKLFAYAGGASVSGNQVFVPVYAQKSNSVNEPVTILLAFQAEPDTPSFNVANLPDNFQILQPDFARTNPTNFQRPDVYTTMAPGSFTYDKETGTIRFDNLSRNSRGSIQDCISLSQPVIIRASGTTDQVIQPEKIGGRWTPLLWYTVFQGLSNSSTPLATGNSIFLGGKSVVPSILALGTLAQTGMVYGIDTDVSTDTNWTIANTNRPWLKQMYQLKVSLSGTLPNPGNPLDPANWRQISVTPNPHVRMPQAFGVSTFDDYRLRLLQTVIGSSKSVSTLAGGDGSLAVIGDQGLYSFDRADFIVCDEGRVVRFDSSGNPLFSSDAYASNGDGGGAATATGLVRPTRAYPVGQSDLLVVDTGGNRVVRISQTGYERRSIASFNLDLNHIPVGWQANSSTNLNAPRDAITYSEYRRLPGSGEEVSNQQAVEYWVHFLVADSGNKRLVDIVDRFTVDSASGMVGSPVEVNGVAQRGVLVWQSPAALSGKDYVYNSISRVWLAKSGGQGRYVYVAGLGGTTPARTDVGLDTPAPNVLREERAGNGGVVVFDALNPNQPLVFNQISIPDLSSAQLFNWTSGTWTTGNRPAVNKRLNNIRSVTASAVQVSGGNAVLAIMVADADGVYESLLDPLATPPTSSASNPDPGSTLPSPRWMINSQAFGAMRWSGRTSDTPSSTSNPLQFLPSYARRLDTGEVMIVNSYFGRARSANTDYKGAVLLLNGDSDEDSTSGAFSVNKPNLGFYTISVRYDLSVVTGPFRGLINPVFADRR